MIYIPFYEPEDEYGWGSNFYKTKPLLISSDIDQKIESWDTTEQYFQAMKFRGKRGK